MPANRKPKPLQVPGSFKGAYDGPVERLPQRHQSFYRARVEANRLGEVGADGRVLWRMGEAEAAAEARRAVAYRMHLERAKAEARSAQLLAFDPDAYRRNNVAVKEA